MEELWKDIHLSSLHENPTSTTTAAAAEDTSSAVGRPRAPPEAVLSLSLCSSSSRDHIQSDDHHNQKDHDDQDLIPIREVGISTPCFISSLNSPFEALAAHVASSSSSPSISLLLTSLCSKNKRVADDHDHDHDSRVDRRYKRMMKNRESAARSRARRQAYTSELEREIAHLVEENAKLRGEQEKLRFSALAEIPEKPTHTRSLTAPF